MENFTLISFKNDILLFQTEEGFTIECLPLNFQKLYYRFIDIDIKSLNEIYNLNLNVISDKLFIKKIDNNQYCLILTCDNQSFGFYEEKIKVNINNTNVEAIFNCLKLYININQFTKEGFKIYNTLFYNIISKLDNKSLKILRKYLLEINSIYATDVCVNEDYDRKYKIFDGDNINKFIEI